MFRRQSFSLLLSVRQTLVAPVVVSRTFQSLTSSSTAVSQIQFYSRFHLLPNLAKKLWNFLAILIIPFANF